MCASQDMKSKTARVSEKIESAIRSAIKYYEEQHDLEWCDGCYDPDEIKEAAEMLLSAKDAEVCICIGYSLGYSAPESLEEPRMIQVTVAPPQHRLYFFPEPQGHGSFRPVLETLRRGFGANLVPAYASLCLRKYRYAANRPAAIITMTSSRFSGLIGSGRITGS